MAVLCAVVKHFGLSFCRQICPMTTVWLKFGGAGLKVLASLPISLGFEDRVTFRRPVTRTDYASGLMAANMSPNRLQELGVEDQL